MKYKVVCEVTFPIYEVTIDVNIPINKSVLYICEMLDRIIVEEIDQSYVKNKDSILVDKKTGNVYDKNILIKNSTINNGTKLVYY